MADKTCLDETMQDLLPLLAHDALTAGEAEAVRAHVAGCAACESELALVRSVAATFTAAAPRVSTANILAGVQRATRLRLESPARDARRTPTGASRRAARWMPRRYAAAAASVLLVVSASLAVLTSTFGPDATTEGGSNAAVDSSGGRVMAAAAGLSVAGGLSDLNDDELTALLDELDRVEATVAAEPATLRRALVDDQENF